MFALLIIARSISTNHVGFRGVFFTAFGFYAVSKPLFWVMCIFVDVIFVSQEMHCKKGTGYFRRSRICLSIQ